MAHEEKMNILGVITARANSRRLPQKNIRDLCGKPLIAYTIEEALKSKLLTRLILSSDSSQCAEIANSYGVEVPFMRPSSLAREDTEHVDTMVHAVGYLENTENYKADIIVILQPTSPLRLASDIDNALTLHIETGTDSVISVENGSTEPNSAFYSMTRDLLMKEHKLYGLTRYYSMPPERSVDIDTQKDFELASMIMRENDLQSNGLCRRRRRLS